MVTLHEVITFLVSMQISISSLQTHNVNRCGRSRHLARKLSLRRKRSSPNVFEMAATETITSIILIKLIRVSLGTVRHPRRFKIGHTLGASLNIRHNLSSSKGPKPLQLKLLTTYIPKTSAFTLAFSTSQRLRTTRASARTFFTFRHYITPSARNF